MTKDKKYIENLFRNFKKNKARLKMLELGLVTDDDYTLGAIDYSKDKIQTSNLSSLDNIVERREKEKEQLKKDIDITNIMFDSLNEKDNLIMTSYYIERLSMIKIAQLINRDDLKTVYNNKERILGELLELI